MATSDPGGASAAAHPVAPAAAVTATAAGSGGKLETQLREAFALIDLDGNGQLSRGEVIRGCREKEKVRLLLGLPRNLNTDDGSTAAFEMVFNKLDPDDSNSVELVEFIRYFSSPQAAAAIKAAVSPPSWVAAAAKAPPLTVGGSREERTRAGFLIFQETGRFEHLPTEWEEEYREVSGQFERDLEQWGLRTATSITESQMRDFQAQYRQQLSENSAFSAAEMNEERLKVEAMLKERVDVLYKPPNAAERRAITATPQVEATLPLARHVEPSPPPPAFRSPVAAEEELGAAEPLVDDDIDEVLPMADLSDSDEGL